MMYLVPVAGDIYNIYTISTLHLQTQVNNNPLLLLRVCMHDDECLLSVAGLGCGPICSMRPPPNYGSGGTNPLVFGNHYKRLIFTTSGPLLENIQTPPIWRQRTRRRNKEKFSREKLHCNQQDQYQSSDILVVIVRISHFVTCTFNIEKIHISIK